MSFPQFVFFYFLAFDKQLTGALPPPAGQEEKLLKTSLYISLKKKEVRQTLTKNNKIIIIKKHTILFNMN